MKKILFLTLAFCMIANVSAFAQQSTFMKKDNVVSLGVGIGGTLYGHYGYWNNVKKIPFFSLSFEHCIVDNLFDEKSSIGVGGLFGYTSIKVANEWRVSDMVIGARGAFHYALVDKLDTYAGFTLGYNIHSWKWINSGYSGNSSGSSGLSWAFFAGARYYFTDAIGAFAEVGYGYSILTLGVSFKF